MDLQANEQQIPIKIESAQGETMGVATIHALPQAVARRKGLYGWLGCWGAAVLMLPIPLVHFIAVPLLLLLGPLVGLVMYKVTSGARDITSGGGACPNCGGAIDLSGRDAHWPLDAVCPACEARLLVREALQPNSHD